MKTAIVALAFTALLSACGSETDTGDDATGQDPTGPASQSPDEAPTGPPWPEFEPKDYTFVYSRLCYCPDVGVRIQVTVEDGEATEATYAESSPGTTKGDPVTQDWQLITIADVIDRANGDGDEIRVNWPADQDYPRRVFVDQMANATDDEVTYHIHSVRAGPVDVDY